MYYFGLFGGMVFAGVVLMYKPDTRYVASALSALNLLPFLTPILF